MALKHSREEARTAKVAAVNRFHNDQDVTGIGIGMTEDRSDYAVTVTVANDFALNRIPHKIKGVPVRAVILGTNHLL